MAAIPEYRKQKSELLHSDAEGNCGWKNSAVEVDCRHVAKARRDE